LMTGVFTLVDMFTALILGTFVVMVKFLSWLILAAGVVMFIVALVIFVDLVILIFSLEAVSLAAKLVPIMRERNINSDNNPNLWRFFIILTDFLFCIKPLYC
jgi:hypothetical protein